MTTGSRPGWRRSVAAVALAVGIVAGTAVVVPAVAAPLPEVPSDHTLLYYNARLALREGQPSEAIELWLVRNALARSTGTVSPYDDDFRSVTWAALGQAGICQDGYPTDDAGAGLWPLALHNWVVQNLGTRARSKRPRPFDAFSVGRQQRLVSLGDVLSVPELDTLHLLRGRCLRAQLALISAGETIADDLTDRRTAARLLQYLLHRAQDTLRPDQVRGRAAIDARLFDVDLQLTALAARAARDESRDRARRGQGMGMSRESVAAMVDAAPAYTFDDDSESARILRRCVDWPASEWAALSLDRGLFLYDHALRYGGEPSALDRIALGVIDRAIDAGQGADVARWIAHRGRLAPEAAPREAIWDGARGERLLGLDPASGFHERAVIALYRGVHQLEGGDLPSALRSIAFAVRYAPESDVAEPVASLARRWLTHVASQFAITDELLVTLQQIVPRHDYAVLLEDLMWRSAFHADRASFDRGVHNQLGKDALERRLARLQPLAAGSSAKFTAGIRDGLADAPSETMKFLTELVQRLELEDADVRAMHVPTLLTLRRLVAPLAVDTGTSGARSRTATALIERLQALIDGLGADPTATAADRARALDPTTAVFAGSVRLAPSDPLPWPFEPAEIPPPSIFTPIALTPREWPDDAGGWVFGWSLGG